MFTRVFEEDGKPTVFCFVKNTDPEAVEAYLKWVLHLDDGATLWCVHHENRVQELREMGRRWGEAKFVCFRGHEAGAEGSEMRPLAGDVRARVLELVDETHVISQQDRTEAIGTFREWRTFFPWTELPEAPFSESVVSVIPRPRTVRFGKNHAVSFSKTKAPRWVSRDLQAQNVAEWLSQLTVTGTPEASDPGAYSASAPKADAEPAAGGDEEGLYAPSSQTMRGSTFQFIAIPTDGGEEMRHAFTDPVQGHSQSRPVVLITFPPQNKALHRAILLAARPEAGVLFPVERAFADGSRVVLDTDAAWTLDRIVALSEGNLVPDILNGLFDLFERARACGLVLCSGDLNAYGVPAHPEEVSSSHTGLGAMLRVRVPDVRALHKGETISTASMLQACPWPHSVAGSISRYCAVAAVKASRTSRGRAGTTAAGPTPSTMTV